MKNLEPSKKLVNSYNADKRKEQLKLIGTTNGLSEKHAVSINTIELTTNLKFKKDIRATAPFRKSPNFPLRN